MLARSRLVRPGQQRPALLEDYAGRGDRVRDELAGVLSLQWHGPPPEPSLVGRALLELIRLAGNTPGGGMALLVDDAHWLDEASLGALGFAARRLAGRAAVVAIAARGAEAPAAFGRLPAELRLEPLSAAQANELLEAAPSPPRGRVRAQLVAQAAGNPLTLVELARCTGADSPGRPRWTGLLLPPTARLAAAFSDGLAQLPEPARRALLLLAAAGDTDHDRVLRAVPGIDPAALAAAEELGFISVDTGGVRFRHPAIPSVVYHGATFARRAAAHQEIAAALLNQPDRHAWHLGAAALQPDESVAALLSATAGQAGRRAGVVAMALALERAAELSPNQADSDHRTVMAAEALVTAGQTEWAADTAASVAELSPEPLVRSGARRVTG